MAWSLLRRGFGRSPLNSVGVGLALNLANVPGMSEYPSDLVSLEVQPWVGMPLYSSSWPRPAAWDRPRAGAAWTLQYRPAPMRRAAAIPSARRGRPAPRIHRATTARTLGPDQGQVPGVTTQ